MKFPVLFALALVLACPAWAPAQNLYGDDATWRYSQDGRDWGRTEENSPSLYDDYYDGDNARALDRRRKLDREIYGGDREPTPENREVDVSGQQEVLGDPYR